MATEVSCNKSSTLTTNLSCITPHFLFLGVEKEYRHLYCGENSIFQVIDEIGPANATNLCYLKGNTILKGPNGETIKQCRCEW